MPKCLNIPNSHGMLSIKELCSRFFMKNDFAKVTTHETVGIWSKGSSLGVGGAHFAWKEAASQGGRLVLWMGGCVEWRSAGIGP